MKLIGNVALRMEHPIDDDTSKRTRTLVLAPSLSAIGTPQIPPKKETQGNQR